jgi:hypothetical protein
MNLKNIRLILAACLLLLSNGAALGAGIQQYTPTHAIIFTQLDKLVIDEPFLKARARVIELGWKPVRLHARRGFTYDGAEKRLADRKIYEVESCSMDAGVNCMFYYRKQKRCLRLDTIGEQVANMKITRWTNECPAD